MFVCIHKKIIVVWKSKLPWDGEGLLSYIEERRAWNNCYGKWAPSSSRCSSFHFVRAVGSQFLDSILPDTSFSTFLPTTTLSVSRTTKIAETETLRTSIFTPQTRYHVIPQPTALVVLSAVQVLIQTPVLMLLSPGYIKDCECSLKPIADCTVHVLVVKLRLQLYTHTPKDKPH